MHNPYHKITHSSQINFKKIKMRPYSEPGCLYVPANEHKENTLIRLGRKKFLPNGERRWDGCYVYKEVLYSL